MFSLQKNPETVFYLGIVMCYQENVNSLYSLALLLLRDNIFFFLSYFINATGFPTLIIEWK